MNVEHSGESLLDRITEQIDSGNLDLPVFSQAAMELQSAADDVHVDAAEIEGMIRGDQVLVAEVLRAANSSFFGGLSVVQPVQSAIVRLGLSQVAHLALATSHRSVFNAEDADLRRMMQQLWTHANATAVAGGWLAGKLGYGKQLEQEVFLGGLLHDVGKLVILRAIDEIVKSDTPGGCLSPELLDEVMVSAHPRLGYEFLMKWNIPELFCEIGRDHELMDFDASKIPLVLVRLANQATSKLGLSLKSDPDLVISALPEAQCVNSTHLLIAELEIMMEDTLSGSIAA